jgi:hypothetical protein
MSFFHKAQKSGYFLKACFASKTLHEEKWTWKRHVWEVLSGPVDI